MSQPTTTTRTAMATTSGQLVATLMMVSACGLLSGCAAFTNPVANGVPVRMIPDELLGESREGFEPVNLALLRAQPPEEFLLDTGDTLGIYVEGIIGDAGTPPPVNLPESSELPPAIGYPFPIRTDGTISLPLAGSIKVSGMTIEDAEEAVTRAFIDKQIVLERDFRIIVTLLRPRTVRVLVVREDNRQPSVTVQNRGLRGIGSSSTTVGGGGALATGSTLELPIYENDLLNALTSTGGVPNNAFTPEVVIYRGYTSGENMADCYACGLPDNLTIDGQERSIITVPLRKRCGEPARIDPNDIVLQDGDIVTLRSRDAEFYYTGGLLPSRQQQLPLDYDLTIVEAVLQSNGPLVNGGINSSNLNGNIVGSGIGNPSPSLVTVLRQLPGGQQVNIMINLNEALRDPRQNILVQADDILLLQENRDEALTRYFFNSVFRTDFFFRVINRGDAQGSASFVLP